jgi:serine/threonine protein kinase
MLRQVWCGGDLQIIIQLMDGTTLSGSAPGLRENKDTCDAALIALEAMHAKGYLHRDVAGRNIIVSPPLEPASPPRIQLIDLGSSSPSVDRAAFARERSCMRRLFVQ